jgi:hypothetical protein
MTGPESRCSPHDAPGAGHPSAGTGRPSPTGRRQRVEARRTLDGVRDHRGLPNAAVTGTNAIVDRLLITFLPASRRRLPNRLRIRPEAPKN